MTMRRFALLALLAAAPAAAQPAMPGMSPEQTRTANEAMSRLRSPVTPSHTVDMCPSTGALRDSIRVAAMSGMSTEQIVEDVIARHGEQIRLLPKRSGAGLLAWIATPLVLLVGVGLIAARLRRDRERAPAPVQSRISEADRARVAAALREMETTGELDR